MNRTIYKYSTIFFIVILKFVLYFMLKLLKIIVYL